jgi:hypothetical protein
MLEFFSLTAVWGGPQVTLREAASRNLKLIRCLAACDPIFGQMWLSRNLGGSDPVTRYREMPLSRTVRGLQDAIESERRRGGREQAGESLGHPFYAYAKDANNNAVLLFTRIGADRESLHAGVPNHVILSIPRKGELAKRLAEPTTARCLFECVVTTMEPVWAVLDQAATQVERRPGARSDVTTPRVGWLTYLPVQPEAVELPHRAGIYRLPKGTIIQVFDELDPLNPEHVRKIADIRKTLDRSGLLVSVDLS